MTEECGMCGNKTAPHGLHGVPFCLDCFAGYPLKKLSHYAKEFRSMELGVLTAEDNWIGVGHGHPGPKCSPVNERCGK